MSAGPMKPGPCPDPRRCNCRWGEGWRAGVASVVGERDQLRETIKRLNRRCQRLEAGMAARLEDMRRRDHRAVGGAVHELIIAPLTAERDRYRRTLEGLGKRGCWMPGDGLCKDHGPLQPLCPSCAAWAALEEDPCSTSNPT